MEQRSQPSVLPSPVAPGHLPEHFTEEAGQQEITSCKSRLALISRDMREWNRGLALHLLGTPVSQRERRISPPLPQPTPTSHLWSTNGCAQ